MSTSDFAWREALTTATLGALGAGATLPIAALFLASDEVLATRSPGATALWAQALGACILFPILAALCLTTAALRPRHVRTWAYAAVLATPLLTGWVFGARCGQADALTLLGALGLSAVAVALSVSVTQISEFARPWLERAWPSVGLIPLLPLIALMLPLGPRPLGEPRAPPLQDYSPPALRTERASTRPNTVVLLTVDTLRADHLDLWGYGRSTLPSLSRIARSGLVLEHHSAASSGTVPSLGTLHTGLTPECTGAVSQGSTLNPGATTLAERFRDAGYRTIAVVTNPELDRGQGFDQGFDHFENLGERAAAEVLDATRAALASLDHDAPVFVWVHLFDPHTPYLSAGRAFAEDPLWTDETRPVIDYGSWGGVPRAGTTGAPLKGRSAMTSALVARYDQEIRSIDLPIQWLIDWTLGRSRDGDGVLLFTADHGETLGRGPRDVAFQHGLQVYEDDLHVPAVLWGSGRVPTGRVGTQTRHLDLVPSLLDAAGLPADEHLPGVSVLQAGPRATASTARSAWWDSLSLQLVPQERQRPTRSIQQDGYKLILYPHHRLAALCGPRSWLDAWRSLWSGIAQNDQLFQVAVDPHETWDRIDALPERAQALRDILAHELEPDRGEACAAMGYLE